MELQQNCTSERLGDPSMKLCEHRVRWFTLAAFMAGLVGVPQAYDNEQVQSHLQPFVGAYLGLYKPNKSDLQNMVSGSTSFSTVMPGGGLELGVAYDRFHVGFAVGYQPANNGNVSGAAPEYFPTPAYTTKDQVTHLASDSGTSVIVLANSPQKYNYYSKYSYDMLPLEAFVDMTLFKNSSAVNFLIGGSAGISFVSLTLPYPVYAVASGDTTRYFLGTNGTDHESLFNFSGYVGARINLADRLNLEGQLGWRYAFTNEIYVSDMDADLRRNNSGLEVISSNNCPSCVESAKSVTSTNQRLDLSGPYARVDLRWTFASQSEKDMDRTSSRREALLGAMVASAHRYR